MVMESLSNHSQISGSALATQVTNSSNDSQKDSNIHTKTTCYSIIHSTVYVYAVILFQGLAQLISSGALLNSSHYFVSHADGSGLHHSLIMDYLLTVLCLSRIIFIMLINIVFKFYCTMAPISYIIYSLLAKTIVFFVFSWIAYQANIEGTLFMVIVLILAFLGNFMGVISFVGAYHFLSNMKPIFSQAMCIGQSSAGVAMSLTKVFVVLVATSYEGTSRKDLDVAVYFAITATATLISALAFLTIRKSHTDPKFQYMSFRDPVSSSNNDPESYIEPQIQDKLPCNDTLYQPQPKHVYSIQYPLQSSSDRLSLHSRIKPRDDSVRSFLLVRGFSASPFTIQSLESAKEQNEESDSCDLKNLDHENTELSCSYFISYYKQLFSVFATKYWFYLCILVHYAQSLFLLPNFCYITKSTHYSGILYTQEMFPVFSYFLYHVSEWCGKLILSISRLRCTKLVYLWIGVISIFGMFPLFMLGNVPVIYYNIFGKESQPLLASDELFFCLVCVFGLAHGYLSTCLVMLVPEIQSSFASKSTRHAYNRDKELVSTLVVYCISIGLLLGAISSLLFKIILLK